LFKGKEEKEKEKEMRREQCEYWKERKKEGR
jgi:hypothetical protein